MSEPSRIRPSFELKPSDSYITLSLLNNIMTSTTIKKAVIEEISSELWYETLHGPGKINFKNNITYEGNMKYGILDNSDPENPSIINFPDGTKYVGTVKNNRITGEGTYTFNNGDTYTGKVLNGLRDGFGVFKSHKNIYYEGEWKKGLKHGKGKISQGNMELEGEWDKGILCGKCRIKWKTGNIFEGELKNNLMDGNGFMIWYNKKEKYIGQWKNNLQNGFGIHIYYTDDNNINENNNNNQNVNNNSNNNNNDNKYFRNRYIGQYKDGKRNGYGKMFYNNGCIYEGYSINNNKDGFGIYYYFDKTKYIGNFQNDIMIDLNESKNNKNKSTTNNKAINQKKHFNKKDRINKNIDGIKIPLFLDDLIFIEPDLNKYLKPIDNLLLRNLSLITHIYLVSCGKEDIKSSDIGMSTVLSDGRSVFNKSSPKKLSINQNIQEQKKLIMEAQQLENEAQKEGKKIIDYDNIYNNDFSFCLNLKKFWKLMRDCGLISPDFTLAQIDRIIFQNKDNYIDMFYIPVFFEKNNKNRELFDDIYDYLYQKIYRAKKDFDDKNKINKEINNLEFESKNKYEDDFNYHEEKNVILLRYFYEILIRIAYVKFPEENFENRVKILFDTLKTYFRSKRKSGSDLSDTMICFLDPKIKNPIQTIDTFINNNYITLQNLFNELYLHSCDNETCAKNCDKTITYRYFYENIILNNEIFSKIFENKMHYIDLITLFFKERRITSTNIDTIDMPKFEILLYIEKVLDIEMIFYEFCELIFFICRKYFQFKHIVLEEEQKPKHNKVDETKRIKKKTRRIKLNEEDKESTKSVIDYKSTKMLPQIEEKIKSEDHYLNVINEIIKTKDEFINKNKINLINKYYYPQLKTHLIIEDLMEQERLRKLEEERKEKDRIRYNNEREAFKDEDINVFKEENEEKTDSDDISDY